MRTGVESGTGLLPTAQRVQEVADIVAGIRYGLTVAVWDHLSPGAGDDSALKVGEQVVPWGESGWPPHWTCLAVIVRSHDSIRISGATEVNGKQYQDDENRTPPGHIWKKRR